MKIGFIGAGRVGTAFGRYLREQNLNILGFYSKSKSSAELAAEFTDSLYFNLNELIEKCNYLFITTPDDVISNVWESIKSQSLQDKKIFHMSGSLSSKIFEGIEEHGALGYSLHPIFPITDKSLYSKLESAVFTIEGNEISQISQFLDACKITYFEIAASSKIKYHAATVFASNYVISLGKIAKNLFLECGISEEAVLNALYPLMHTSVENIKHMGFENALTGPIVRGDVGVVRNHLGSLKEYSDIYSSLGLVATDISFENGKIDKDIQEQLIDILGGDR
jgi:predicted short-subunit dehydrogenase-like oxidoreductase (DUF2520 family)